MMKRRDFLALAGTISTVWPFAVRSQSATPIIGFLNSAAPNPSAHLFAALHRGLNEVGFVEGRNVTIEQRWAENRYERLPALAADLVRRRVTVIVAGGGNVSTLAAKAATTTIPIVFPAATDPVRAGFVASLNRPGGNITGIAVLGVELDGKRLELLHELVPKLHVIGVLVNPNRPDSEQQTQDVEAAAGALRRRISLLRAGTERGIEAAFAMLGAERIGALMVAADPFFANRRELLISLAARNAVPTIYPFRDFVTAGGLISYGASLPDSYRQAGVYTGRILKGAKPADLPVLQPTKFDLVINLISAKALGLTIPEVLLSRADEIVE